MIDTTVNQVYRGYVLKLACPLCGYRWTGRPNEACPACGSDDVEPQREAA